jgi:hypothetical protein
MSYCPDHGSDERPWMCLCTKERNEQLEHELAAARESLQEIVAGFVVCGCHRVKIYNHPPITENTLNRWCAGLEDA